MCEILIHSPLLLGSIYTSKCMQLHSKYNFNVTLIFVNITVTIFNKQHFSLLTNIYDKRNV
jgi:hypothetical protein